MVMWGSLIFLFGLFSVAYMQKFFLSLLLCLEVLMMGLFLIVLFVSLGSWYEMLMFFFVLVVSEASLGLSVLILGVYFWGGDIIKSLDLLGW